VYGRVSKIRLSCVRTSPQTLTVKLMAVRDVTICLLAAARIYSNQTALFREISEGLDKRLAQTTPQTASQQIAAMGEQLRVETDLIIGSAQRALGHGTN